MRALMAMTTWLCLSVPGVAQVDPDRMRRLKDGFDRIVLMIGTAKAIEGNCAGFEATGEMHLARATLQNLGEKAGIGIDIEVQVAMATVAAGQYYELKRRPREFCKRVLDDWGPGAPQPIVQRKRS